MINFGILWSSLAGTIYFMQEKVTTIISDGTKAPSGDNCQPWSFVVNDNVIYVYNRPEVDQSIYNVNQRCSYISHGALIENIIISASHHGFNARAEIFPDKKDLNLVSKITLEPNSNQHNDYLYQSIDKRHTNRKDHYLKEISEQDKRLLSNSIVKFNDIELIIKDDKKSLSELGKALAVNERILFSNKHLHKFFYDHIIWDEKDQDKSGGFYIKTLEFLPHQLKAVKLLKSKFILSILNFLIKISDKIAQENSNKYATSGALIGFFMTDENDENFVNCGRAIERVWLEATRLGLSVHPCTGILYCMQRLQKGGDSFFSKKDVKLIESSYEVIKAEFGMNSKIIPMIMRIGHSDPPTAYSKRLVPNIKFK